MGVLLKPVYQGNPIILTQGGDDTSDIVAFFYQASQHPYKHLDLLSFARFKIAEKMGFKNEYAIDIINSQVDSYLDYFLVRFQVNWETADVDLDKEE
jgi:hypothetical protein